MNSGDQLVEILTFAKNLFVAISGINGIVFITGLVSPKFADLVFSRLLEKYKRNLDNQSRLHQAALSNDAENHKHLLQKERDIHIEKIKSYYTQVGQARIREQEKLGRIITCIEECMNSLHASSAWTSSYNIARDFLDQCSHKYNLPPDLKEDFKEFANYIENPNLCNFNILCVNNEILIRFSKISNKFNKIISHIPQFEKNISI